MKTKHINPLVLTLALALVAFAAVPADGQYSDDIFDCVRNSDSSSLNTLLVNGEDANQVNKANNTPLMLAAKIGDRLTVEALLANDADPNKRNNAGATALMIASKYGHAHVVEQLLLYGANPLIKNNNGHTASRFAYAYLHPELYERLLEAEKEAVQLRKVSS